MRVKVGNGPDLHNWNSFYPLYYTDTYNVNSDLKKKTNLKFLSDFDFVFLKTNKRYMDKKLDDQRRCT